MFAGTVPPPRDAIWTWKAVHLFTSAAKPFFCRLAIEGRENIPATGGCVLTCNHTMGPDFLVIGYLSPRQIHFMVKAEIMDKYRRLGQFLAYNGCFPIRRGDGDKEAITHAVDLVKTGHVLGMFPEGTRSKGRGLHVAKTGTARMAIEMNCPIIPMTVTGSDQFFKKFPRRSNVTVKLLPSILPNPRDTPLSLTDRLMFTLAAGLPESMRGVYAEVPKGFGD